MRRVLALCLLLAACGERPVAFQPAPVDMPVVTACPMPAVARPPDLMAQTTAQTPLTEALKNCLRQTLADQGYQAELEAGIKACR